MIKRGKFWTESPIKWNEIVLKPFDGTEEAKLIGVFYKTNRQIAPFHYGEEDVKATYP